MRNDLREQTRKNLGFKNKTIIYTMIQNLQKLIFLSKKLQKKWKNNNLRVLDEFTLKIVSADNLDQVFELWKLWIFAPKCIYIVLHTDPKYQKSM